jgi:hypothetical protein
MKKKIKEKRKLDDDLPTSMLLPARLDTVIDSVNLGTVLKRLTDGRWAVMVDWLGEGIVGRMMVAVVSDVALRRMDKDGNLPASPKDYQFIEIKDGKEWLVVALGSDYALIE